MTERVPAASLTPYPGNPRRGDLAKLRASIRAHGQYAPLIARRADRVVLAGNHTLAALRAEGHDQVDVVWIDADDRLSRLIVAADNRLPDLAIVDPAQLVDLLTYLAHAEQLAGTGYDPDDVTAMRLELADLYAPPPPLPRPERALVLHFTRAQRDRYRALVDVLTVAWRVDERTVVARALAAHAAVKEQQP